MPPVVREHKRIVVLSGPFQLLAQAPVQPMQRLTQVWGVPPQCNSPFRELPEGAQLLRFTPLRSSGGILQAEDSHNNESAEQAWGIPFSPEELIYEAVNRGHPKSFSKLVPDILHKAIEKNFASGSSSGELAGMRAKWFSKWMERAKHLAGDEESLKAGLPMHVRHILAPKRLLLWKEILAELNYPDAQVFEELLSGTNLVGEVPICGMFEKKFKPADITVASLQVMSKSEKRRNFYRCCSSGDDEIDAQVYEKTLEEVELGWTMGPIPLGSLPDNAVLSRRFGLRQPGKIRLIDDLTGSHVNSTVQTGESPKPQNIDYIGAMLLQALQSGESNNISGRTYDLKSAYKQLAISCESLQFAYVVVFNPKSRKAEVLQLLAALFGATRSVYLFLRVIHSVWYIGVCALQIPWSHIFDDFVVFCRDEQIVNTGQTVELLFKLLGWKFAETGDKAIGVAKVFTALGVEISLSKAMTGEVEFVNTEKRKTELTETISNILEKGTLTVTEAQKLRGRMQFMDGQIFGRLGRLCMRAVTDHAFTKRSTKLSEDIQAALKRFLVFLEHSGPRRLHLNSHRVWFLFTDACYEPGSKNWQCGLGGVLVNHHGAPRFHFSCCLSTEHMKLLGNDKKKTIIFEAELLALILAFAVWQRHLVAVPLIGFVDNNSARDVAISGSGRNAVAVLLVDFLLKLEMSVCASPWYARVPTPSNIADEPSRGVERLLELMGSQKVDPSHELNQIMEVLGESAVKLG